MRKCIILILITGIIWAQTGFDKLILKGGQKYLWKFSNIDNQTVYFKPENASTSQPINVKYIHTLQLKDGTEIINGGIINEWNIGIVEDYLIKEIVAGPYEKLTIEEKAIYHKLRKRNLRQIITCSAIIFILGPFFYIGMVESGLGGGPSFPLPWCIRI